MSYAVKEILDILYGAGAKMGRAVLLPLCGLQSFVEPLC
jgi:hypothetical protein